MEPNNARWVRAVDEEDIPRPQLTFSDQVDNSARLWLPKITEKPNHIKPLVLELLYDDAGEVIGYENPYKVELELYEPPPDFVMSQELLPFPPSLEETPLTMVHTEQQMDQLLNHLSTVREFAVDVEHHSYRSYQGITCLIQITTTEGGDFIIDALAARNYVHKLNLVFTDPKILKVFHGALSDILWLQRDFSLYVVGMFDTYLAARVLQLPSLSLGSLLMRYCYMNADKQFQLADWRIRPLPEELVRYARSDTHHLLYIWRCMRLEMMNTRGAPSLRIVFARSRHVCKQSYTKTVVGDDAHLMLYMQSQKAFDMCQMEALKVLYNWRDQQARNLDESPEYLLPDHVMLELAEILPRDQRELLACCRPMSRFLKEHLRTVHDLLMSVSDDSPAHNIGPLCRRPLLEPQLFLAPGALFALMPPLMVAYHPTYPIDWRGVLQRRVSRRPGLYLVTRPGEAPNPTPAFYPNVRGRQGGRRGRGRNLRY